MKYGSLVAKDNNYLNSDLFKSSILQVLKKEFYLLHSELESVLNCIDLTHVCSVFLSSNDVVLKSHNSIQQKKYNTLFKNRRPKHNPDEVILNYSTISLSDTEKWLLVRGLRFSLPPKRLNCANYLTDFELFLEVYGTQMFYQMVMQILLKLRLRMLL